MSKRALAREHFHQARRQAILDAMTARLTGRDMRMLPFETIRSNLRHQSPLYRGIQEVNLNQIVGSVGRYHEFNRKFLPLKDNLVERWVGVETLVSSGGWPPVDLYQVGSVYFVQDGNHRTSVARKLNLAFIEAHVWQFPDEIRITADDRLDDLLIRLDEHNFMAHTGLATHHPDHNIRFTSPGSYAELLAQIEDLRARLAIIDGEEMPYAEAVLAWYELMYLPITEIIANAGLLNDFPGRTEADLFVWFSANREHLKALYGECKTLEELVKIMVGRFREGRIAKVTRTVRRILRRDALPPLNPVKPPSG